MQKKIIALAIASALTMPALAMAAPTVYGKVNVAYELTDTGSDITGTGTNAAKRNQVSSNYSVLGFKGSEDLGNDLTGIYQIEGRVGVDTGNAAGLFTENTFLGLSGNFGTVLMGNHYTPYRLSTRSIDVFDNSIADNRSLMGMTTVGFTHAYAATDVLVYASPDFNGFNFSAAYVGKNDNSLPTAAASTVVNATSISAMYGMDGWSATLSNQTVTAEDKVTAANESELSATKLAGTYAMDAFTVGLVYEM
ncbi:MAG: porin, partial [Gallionella sp.]